MSTEAQMCKILTALDTASNKINEMNKTSPKVEEDDQEENSSSSLDDEEDENENKCDQRNRSVSLSSSNSSIEEDQSAPIDEQNQLTRRKHR
jgi:hypothetical protein